MPLKKPKNLSKPKKCCNYFAVLSFYPVMKPTEEHDPTWKLLLRSKPQQPSAFFVRNVVREARILGADGRQGRWTAFAAWLKRPLVAVPLAAGAAAALVTALTVIQPLAPPSANVDVAFAGTAGGQASMAPAKPTFDLGAASAYDQANAITEDLERIGYLGELVTISDPGELDDAALADLLALR